MFILLVQKLQAYYLVGSQEGRDSGKGERETYTKGKKTILKLKSNVSYTVKQDGSIRLYGTTSMNKTFELYKGG